MALWLGDRRTGLEFWGFSWTCGLELFPTLVPYSAFRRGLDELVLKVFLGLTCHHHILNLDSTMEKVSPLSELRWRGWGLERLAGAGEHPFLAMQLRGINTVKSPRLTRLPFSQDRGCFYGEPHISSEAKLSLCPLKYAYLFSTITQQWGWN